MSSVQFLQTKFPGQTEQEYRSHLGSFGITGLTSLQKIGTLSGGQKSRVAFAVLSLQRPHILLLDEVSINHVPRSLKLIPFAAFKPLGYRRYRCPHRSPQDVQGRCHLGQSRRAIHYEYVEPALGLCRGQGYQVYGRHYRIQGYHCQPAAGQEQAVVGVLYGI